MRIFRNIAIVVLSLIISATSAFAFIPEYDALGRKIKNIRPSGAEKEYIYDSSGNRIGKTGSRLDK